MFLGDELLGDVITGLLTRLKAGDLKAEVVRTYIQAVGAVRWVGGSCAWEQVWRMHHPGLAQQLSQPLSVHVECPCQDVC
jgi:hypothetical protein